MSLINDLRPPSLRDEYTQYIYSDTVAQLASSSAKTVIAHIDSGIASHPSLGYAEGAADTDPPENILLDKGVNFFDPRPDQDPLSTLPVSPLKRSGRVLDKLIEYPDHGVKTLSAILGATKDFRGVAPGAKVIPYRVANGPLFQSGGLGGPYQGAPTRLIGDAIFHALNYRDVRVINISMGNPGNLGPLQKIINGLGGQAGIDSFTANAIDRAYRQGVIIVAAAGQVTEANVYPGMFSRVITAGGYDYKDGKQNIGLYDHYPNFKYLLQERVDVSALAMRMNRASFNLKADPPVPEYAEQSREWELSGTSYAAAQVSAVAALWVEKYHENLENLFANNRYKIVEAFRAALKTYGNINVIAELPFKDEVEITKLDIVKVLATPPVDPAVLPVTRAVDQLEPFSSE